MLVCVDNGFDSTKVRMENKLFKFPSKWEQTNDDTETGILKYKGESWVNRGKDDIEVEKTNSMVHKLSTLKALSKCCEYSRSFDLVLDLPLMHYRNKKFREEFKEYMSNPGVDHVNYKGRDKEFIINGCTVAPQGVSALYSDITRYKDRLVGVIDLGGITVDCCIVENLKPITDSIFTVNMGDRIVESAVKTKVNEKYLLNIQDYEIKSIVQNGVSSILGSKEFINQVVSECFDNLFRELRAKNWSLETLDIVLVGGGALKYADILAERISNISIIDNPLYANVNGLYQIGVMLNG